MNLEFGMYLKSYPLNRLQVVYCEGTKPCTCLTTSGDPQGFNIGPLLFWSYFNGFCNVIP